MKDSRIPATRLAVRIYVVILLAFLAIAALLVVSVRFRSDLRWRRAFALAPELSQLCTTHAPGSPELNAKLEGIQRDTGAEVTLYSSDGKLLGTSARHAPPPVPEAQRRAGRLPEPFLDGQPPVGALPSLPGAPPPAGPSASPSGPPSGPVAPRPEPPPDGHPPAPIVHVLPLSIANLPGAYAIVRIFNGFPPPPAPVTEIVVVLVCLGLASVTLAVMLARPLKQIAGAARAFGAGDLSARSQLKRRDEMGELSRTFDEMADRVTQLLNAQRELMASVSHEIRTPLARMRVALDLAREGDAQMAQQSLADIAQDLGDLEQLVDDVMTMARLEAQSARLIPPLRRAPIDARHIAEHALAHFSAAHADRPLDVDLPAQPITIDGDQNLLRRVLENLLENAHKYSPAEASIRMVVQRSEGAARFMVADKGQGIAAEDLPHVFRPFFRADRSRNRGTGGVGMGLALAKRIVEAHGGDIRIESQVDQGTAVTFQVPV